MTQTAQDTPTHSAVVEFLRPIAWNDEKILALAGNTPETVRALLREHRQPLPTEQAVYQWVSRGRIAQPYRPRIVYALLRADKITFADLFTVLDRYEFADGE